MAGKDNGTKLLTQVVKSELLWIRIWYEASLRHRALGSCSSFQSKMIIA